MYTTTTTIKLPSILTNILNNLLKIGIKPILVGGCIRDHFLKIDSKDYDIELYGVDNINIVLKALEQYGSVKEVGKSFGVLILHTDNYSFDFTLPRLEEKIGAKHTDFKITTKTDINFKQASKRRDFTINSIGYDYGKNIFLDPYNGIEDIKNRLIKHIDDKSFCEDSLRVYRAVQFSSRFNFTIDDKTLLLCKKIVHSNELDFLAKERVYEEFKKLFLKSKKPSIAFELLKQLGIIKKYFSELDNLIGCIQDKQYHPEGDVWIHTMLCIDELSKLTQNLEDQNKKLILFYAILCHDLGKPFCTKEINGHITSHKHESLGIKPTISLLSKLTNEKKLIEEVCSLVETHLRPFQLYNSQSSLNAIKRLSLKVNIEDLCIVALADCLGRDIKDKQKCYRASSWLLEKAKELEIQNEAIKPIVQGKDLIVLGFKPSKKFKDILKFAFNLQIDDNLQKEKILEKIKNNYQR